MDGVADGLRKLGVGGVLITAAQQGRITKLECEMPECLCPQELGGRSYFEPKAHPPIDWMPTPDHYPVLKMDGGRLTVNNVRLAHRLCNRVDYAKGVGRPYKKDLARAEVARQKAIKRRVTPPSTSSDRSQSDTVDCPFPNAHDKLREAHYFFHRMIDEIHEPEPFRWNLNAFLQAARSVDYLLRSHGNIDREFASWYKVRLTELQQQEPTLRRLVESRDLVVHHRTLTHLSRVRGGLFRGRSIKFVVGTDEAEQIEVPSKHLLEHYVKHMVGSLVDRRHRAIGEQIGVERVWIVPELDPQEDVTLACYRTLGKLFSLMTEAHAFYQVDFSPDDESEPSEPSEEQLAEVRVLLETDLDPSLIEKWNW